RVADGARDDATRVRALSHRLFLHGNVFKQPAKVAELDAEASSALQRLAGQDPRAEEAYHYGVGMAFRGMRSFDRALAELERDAILTESVFGKTSYEAARSLSGLCIVRAGRGEMEAAISYCNRAAQAFKEIFGPKHPDYALALHNLGVMLLELDRIDAG